MCSVAADVSLEVVAPPVLGLERDSNLYIDRINCIRDPRTHTIKFSNFASVRRRCVLFVALRIYVVPQEIKSEHTLTAAREHNKKHHGSRCRDISPCRDFFAGEFVVLPPPPFIVSFQQRRGIWPREQDAELKRGESKTLDYPLIPRACCLNHPLILNPLQYPRSAIQRT